MTSVRGYIHTPGKRRIFVGILSAEHPVFSSTKRRAIIPRLDDSGLRFTAEICRERIDHKRDCPVAVTGDRGVGKSTVISKIARIIDPDYAVKDVAFKLEDFERIFNENPIGDGKAGKYPQVWLDEAGHALFGNEWFKEEQRVIAKMLIIGRIKQQILWFAVPKLRQLNNQVRNMPYMWIHIAEPRAFHPGLAIVRIAEPETQSEWYSESHWTPKYAFIFTEDKSQWWTDYEKRKVEFVNEVTKMAAERRARKREIELVETVKKLRADGKTQAEIGYFVDRDQSTISKMLSETGNSI